MNRRSREGEVTLLADALARSTRVTVFTGAGISTESGIPDFRSPGGLWSRLVPIDFRDYMASEDARRESWRQKLELDGTFGKALPNRGHRAVAELVRRGACHAVITQNVDGLHQLAGVPDEQVIELHGNNTYAVCLSCGLRHELEPLLAAFRRDEIVPVCRDCGGIVKSATISFGQLMPQRAMLLAEAATLDCDLFLVAGSSLVVYPAAGFPALAARNGARLVILNRDRTDLDDMADLVIHDEIGPVLGAAVGVD